MQSRRAMIALLLKFEPEAPDVIARLRKELFG